MLEGLTLTDPNQQVNISEDELKTIAVDAIQLLLNLTINLTKTNSSQSPTFERYIRCFGNSENDRNEDQNEDEIVVDTYKSYRSALDNRRTQNTTQVLNRNLRVVKPLRTPQQIMDGESACNARFMYAVGIVTLDEKNEPVMPVVELMVNNLNPVVTHIYNGLDSFFMKGNGGNVKIGKYEFGTGFFEGRHLNVTKVDNGKCLLKNDHMDVNSCLTDPQCGRIEGGYIFYSENTTTEGCNPGKSWDVDDESYGQAHDALGYGSALYDMLERWYRDTGLSEHCPKMKGVTHFLGDYDNAFYIRTTCSTFFGGGGRFFYPLAVIDVTGHEIAHAYTYFNSMLNYNYCQSGSLNEAFSDMMGETLEAYVRNYNNDWLVGFDAVKGILDSPFLLDALRYFKDPTANLRAIDCADNFDRLDPHFGSGVFNKAFYILSNKPNWTIRRAFALFLHANHYYWADTDGYAIAADKVWEAANSDTVPGYIFSNADVNDVVDAFRQVGVLTDCPPGFQLIVLGIVNPEQCPMDYRRSCVQIVTEAANWADAKNHCDKIDAVVLTINTENEESIATLLNQYIDMAEMDDHFSSYKRYKYVYYMKDQFWAGKLETTTDEPTDLHHGTKSCLAIKRNCYSSSCEDWVPFPDHCFTKKKFICETKTCKRR